MGKQEKDQSVHADLIINKLLMYLINGDQEHSVASTYLFILIGSHSYELCLREGAVHHHPVGASYTNYVYLWLIFMQGVQHYLQKTKQRQTPTPLWYPTAALRSGSLIDQMSLLNLPSQWLLRAEGQVPSSLLMNYRAEQKEPSLDLDLKLSIQQH